MGGGSSTPRSISIQEEEVSGVIKVSDAVARRLLGSPEPADYISRPQGQPSPQQQSEFNRLEDHYKRKIRALETENENLMQETQAAFAEAVKEVEQRFQTRTAPLPICQDLQDELLKCYKANPKHTLNCSPQVKAFNECVQRQRERILSRKEG